MKGYTAVFYGVRHYILPNEDGKWEFGYYNENGKWIPVLGYFDDPESAKRGVWSCAGAVYDPNKWEVSE